jgi:hypothetical protein
MTRLLTILIDALGYEFVSQKTTPYLWEFANAGFKCPIKPILAYSDGIRATIFTGTYPDIHNYWIMYKYSSDNSPFRTLTSLKFIDKVPISFVKRGAKFALSATLGRIIGNKHGYSSFSTHNIPFKIIDKFDYTLKRSMFDEHAFGEIPTLFDVLRKNDIEYACVDSADLGFMDYFGSSERIRGKLLRILNEFGNDIEFTYIYLHHLDNFAHRYGIASPRFMKELRKMDETVKLIVEKMRQRFGDDLRVIILSDHGMVDTQEFVSFENLIKDRGFGDDYMFFLDSTMVRFWYFNEGKCEKVRKWFEKLGYGSFLTTEQRKHLRIDFGHRQYGDEIYLLKPEYSIFPNFMSWLKPKSMHAYHPDYRHQQGIFMMNRTDSRKVRGDISIVKLVDVMPTVLDALNLKIPKTCEGKSL